MNTAPPARNISRYTLGGHQSIAFDALSQRLHFMQQLRGSFASVIHTKDTANEHRFSKFTGFSLSLAAFTTYTYITLLCHTKKTAFRYIKQAMHSSTTSNATRLTFFKRPMIILDHDRSQVGICSLIMNNRK